MARLFQDKQLREVLLKSLDDCLNGAGHALSCKLLNRVQLEEDEFCRKTVKFSTFLEVEKKANSQQSSVRFTPENLYPDTSRVDWRSDKRFTRVISHLRGTKRTRTSTKKAKSSTMMSTVAEDNLAILKGLTGRSTKPDTATLGSFRVISTDCSKNLFGVSESEFRQSKKRPETNDSHRTLYRFENEGILNPNVIREGQLRSREDLSWSFVGLAPLKENSESGLNLNWESMNSKCMSTFQKSMASSLNQNLFRSKKNIRKRFGEKNQKGIPKHRSQKMENSGPSRAGARRQKRRRKRYRRRESFVIRKDFSRSVNARRRRSGLRLKPKKKLSSHLMSFINSDQEKKKGKSESSNWEKGRPENPPVRRLRPRFQHPRS